MFALLEGDRTFRLLYGFVTSGLCLAVAIPIRWWVLPAGRRSFIRRSFS
jgi:hypothetical protein